MRRLILSCAALLAVAACSDGSSIVAPPPTPPPPPPTSSVDFTGFVKAELADTSETRDPVEINDLEFEFNDQDNPDAFNDLFEDN